MTRSIMRRLDDALQAFCHGHTRRDAARVQDRYRYLWIRRIAGGPRTGWRHLHSSPPDPFEKASQNLQCSAPTLLFSQVEFDLWFAAQKRARIAAGSICVEDGLEYMVYGGDGSPVAPDEFGGKASAGLQQNFTKHGLDQQPRGVAGDGHDDDLLGLSQAILPARGGKTP